jgi:starch-binding outer membrane protein, SusD/RagB family
MNKILIIILFSVLILNGGCRKFVEVPSPTTEIVAQTVFSNDATATSAILGIYSSMQQDVGMASVNTSLFAGLSADEMIFYANDANLGQIYSNSLLATNTDISAYWGNAYQYIFGANALLAGLENNAAISAEVKQQLTGEAKFIRAFCYFYLVNLFGDVPLILTTDYKENSIAFRAASKDVYAQITIDLQDAESVLPENYVQADNTATSERVRPNKWAAAAMLSRVYLYEGNWGGAVTESDHVINQSGMYSLATDLDSCFLANNSEAILQLIPVNSYNNGTWDAFVFLLSGAPSGAYGISLSNGLFNAFETGDQRRVHWVDSIIVSGYTYYFAYKYKSFSTGVLSEYETLLRLSEQYLIRAEANAMTNNLTEATSDLNTIRHRAGLANTTASDIPSLLQAIQTERRFELFSEWGHRWLDLKRTGTATAVLSPIKSGWQPSDTLYPIPQNDRTTDPNLTQNPNY